jgi:hypothetical protein
VVLFGVNRIHLLSNLKLGKWPDLRFGSRFRMARGERPKDGDSIDLSEIERDRDFQSADLNRVFQMENVMDLDFQLIKCSRCVLKPISPQVRDDPMSRTPSISNDAMRYLPGTIAVTLYSINKSKRQSEHLHMR